MKEKFVLQMIFNLTLNLFSLVVSYFKLKNIDIILLGDIALAGNITGIFTMFLDLGVSSIHYQFTSKQDFSTYFGSYTIIKIVLILSNYTLPFIWYFALGFSSDPIVEEIVLLSLLAGLVNAFAQIFDTNLRTKMKFLKAETANFTTQLVNTGIQGYVAINATLFANPAIIIMQVNLWMMVVRFIVYFLMNLNEKIFKRPDTSKMKEYLIAAKPLMIQSVISIASSYIGGILLGYNQGVQELQYYSFVMTFFVNTLLTAVSLAITSNFDAIFPKIIAEKRYKEVTELANQFEKYALVFFLFIVIAVWCFGGIVIGLLLPKYLPSVPYLNVLILIPLMDAILRPYQGNIFQGGKISLNAKLAILSIIGSMVMQIIFIPYEVFSIKMLGWGTWGLVFVNIFWYICSNLILRYYSKKYYGISSHVKHLKCALIAVGSFALIYIIMQLLFIFFGVHYWDVILSAGMLFAVYFGLLFLLKELTKTDIQFFISLMHPKSYIDSFKKEFSMEPQNDSN